MATTIQPPVKERAKAPRPANGSGGGWRDLAPADGSLRAVQDRGPQASTTGVWVGLAAITMSFAALTSALFVRQGSANDWRHFALPSILYFNTVLLIGSSVTLETARRNFRRAAHDARSALAAPQWLYATLVLGLCFVAGQYLAWMKLRAEGLFLATNPSSSFFYVLTAVHALHVLGGLLGLTYVTWKMRRRVLRLNSLAAASHYWHFMDVLWLYVFFVLWIKMA